METTLDSALALALAQSLKTIPGAEYLPEAAINAIGKDLERWCTGGFTAGLMWSPESQAEWLVTEARETWDEWQGSAALRRMFRARFTDAAATTVEPLSYEAAIAKGLIHPDPPHDETEPPRPQAAQVRKPLTALTRLGRPDAIGALQHVKPITEADMRAALEKHQREKAARAKAELPPDTPSES